MIVEALVSEFGPGLSSDRNVSYGGAPGSAGVLTWSHPEWDGLEVDESAIPLGLAYTPTSTTSRHLGAAVVVVTNQPNRMATCLWDTFADRRQPLKVRLCPL